MCFLRSPLRFVRPPLSFPPIHTRLPVPRQPLHPLHVHVREYASRLGLTSRVSSTIFNSTKRFDRVIPWWPEAESLFFHLLRCRVQLPRTVSSTIVIQRTTDVSRRVSHRTMPRRLCSLSLSFSPLCLTSRNRFYSTNIRRCLVFVSSPGKRDTLGML